MTNPSQFYTHHTALPPIFKNLWHIIMFQDNHNVFIAEKQSASLHHAIPFPSPPPFPYKYCALYSSHRLTLFELNIKKSKRDRNTKKRKKDKFS